MLNDKTVRNNNFTCVHAGPKEGWTEFRLEPPGVPMPTKGKLFLRNYLGSAGLEMSLTWSRPARRYRSCTSTGRTTRFTSKLVAGAGVHDGFSSELYHSIQVI